MTSDNCEWCGRPLDEGFIEYMRGRDSLTNQEELFYICPDCAMNWFVTYDII